jgi:hypothetical protein
MNEACEKKRKQAIVAAAKDYSKNAEWLESGSGAASALKCHVVELNELQLILTPNIRVDKSDCDVMDHAAVFAQFELIHHPLSQIWNPGFHGQADRVIRQCINAIKRGELDRRRDA